ncbi:14-3-3-like protein GF14-D isoform X2 [Miscanthus floridulus]|uniref:14-3-3-like protein GF14-D isoform X2 n=1 Tax=Miscanthus floridulus TaxID=154761 RepID=UPI0034598A2E
MYTHVPCACRCCSRRWRYPSRRRRSSRGSRHCTGARSLSPSPGSSASPWPRSGRGSRDGEELSVEERNLLCVTYKNVIGAGSRGGSSPPSSRRRAAGTRRTAHAAAIRAYRSKIEVELAHICDGDPTPVVDEGRLPQDAAESTMNAYKAAQVCQPPPFSWVSIFWQWSGRCKGCPPLLVKSNNSTSHCEHPLISL